MPRKNIRYGLNLNRGLCFEGVIGPTNIPTFGAYLAEALPQESTALARPYKLVNLEGHVYGVDARSRGTETWRTLTAAPAVGNLCLTHFDRHLQSAMTAGQLVVEGMGILHIPELAVTQRYRQLFPDHEYLTQPSGSVDDTTTFTLDEAAHCWRFSVSVDPPAIQKEH